MRRLTTVCGLVFVLALSGWSHVRAHASCAHATPVSDTVAAQDHACCHAHLAQHAAHGMSDAHHSSARAHVNPIDCQQTHGTQAAPLALSSDQSDPFCAHCASSTAPAQLYAPARVEQTTKRAAVYQATAAALPHVPALLYRAQLTAQPHAPPTRARYLSLNILLI